MIGVVIAVGAAAFLLLPKKPKRSALDAARSNVRVYGAQGVLIKRMFAPVDQAQQPPPAREKTPSGVEADCKNFLNSDAVKTGVSYGAYAAGASQGGPTAGTKASAEASKARSYAADACKYLEEATDVAHEGAKLLGSVVETVGGWF